jgi:cysteine desulfurase
VTVYLDHAATSPMPRRVIEAMWPYLTDEFANATSQHDAGKRAAAGLAAARDVVAGVLNCRPAEVVFTSGGTESDNLALKGVALADPRGRHIVTSVTEHEAVLESCRYLQRHHGFRVTQVGVDGDGLVDLDALGSVLTPEVTLCSIHYANNEVGTVQPMSRIAALCHAAGVLLHTDAVQAAGILPGDVQALGADLLSLSGHKFGAPKGTGVLFVRSNVFLEPLLHGGGQERRLRSGTSNVAGAVGLATALHLAEQARPDAAASLTLLRDRVIDEVLALAGDVRLTGHRTERLPQHASFCFPGRSGESVLLDLERQGFACSAGSACAAGHDEASPVLLAMGIQEQVARTAVRFTLGPATTPDDIDSLVGSLAAILR